MIILQQITLEDTLHAIYIVHIYIYKLYVVIHKLFTFSVNSKKNSVQCIQTLKITWRMATFYDYQSPISLCNSLYCCCRSNCSNSSAERNKKAADSRYPVISCLTAAISPVLNLWFRSGFCFILKSAGPTNENNQIVTLCF